MFLQDLLAFRSGDFLAALAAFLVEMGTVGVIVFGAYLIDWFEDLAEKRKNKDNDKNRNDEKENK